MLYTIFMNELKHLEIFNEAPIIEQFQELKPLLNRDGSSSDFTWKGKKFRVALFGKEIMGVQDMVFGLWEITADNQKLPVGYADCSISEKQAVIDFKKYDISIPDEDLPIEFHDLEKIPVASEQEEATAFLISKQHRRSGLADVFNAQILVLLEGIGAKKVKFGDDLTIHTDEEPQYLPQFKGDAENIRPQNMTSFYSKYAGSQTFEKVEYDFGDGPAEAVNTYISTHISTMQQSLLHEAFGHYHN
ncbi:MAG: hypothetical protein BroJett025_03830 [Patescibacteria group bacterium]|nr:MAG: hypothetical protein BroJett025_03830 [Patescibacteria group bacterium]